MKVEFKKDMSKAFGLWLVIPTIAILWDSKSLEIALMWMHMGLYFEFNRKKK